MSTIWRSTGLPLTGLQARQQLLVRKTGEEAVEGSLEVGDSSLCSLGQAHVLEPARMQAPLLSRQVGEVLSGDRRPPWIVALPMLGRHGLFRLAVLGEPRE